MAQHDPIALALEKQRLIQDSARLRADFARHANGVRPLFTTADRVHEGLRWLRAHPAILVGAGVFLIVVRPRLAWRWARRAWSGWRWWQRARGALDHAV